MRSLFLMMAIAVVYSSLAFTIDSRKDKIAKLLPEAYVEVPAGEAMIDSVVGHVDGFYISRNEVSNLDYAEFLWHLKNDGLDEDLSIASIRNENWLIPGSEMEPIAEAYHTHPSYREYPVVNISYDAAVLYCQWLEGILGARFGEEYSVKAMLPSREQWVRAARYDDLNSTYAWGGSYLRNSKGDMLCNFKHIGSEAIHFNSSTGEYEITDSGLAGSMPMPVPCESYSKNALGLYNMNGNVSEMINQEGVAVGGSWNDTGYDVRIESTTNYHAPSPTVGFRPILKIEDNH